MNLALDYLPIARMLARSLGPLQQANDGNLTELAAAQANYELLLPDWCPGHPSADPSNHPTLEVYYHDLATDSHGWMCSKCRKITQTG